MDWNFEDKQTRQLMIEQELSCKIIRANSDKKDFNIYRLINQVRIHIEQLTKISLIDDLSKRLLGLKFKSNHSINSKSLKWIVKKV